jgi:TetR/AcrR family acrAB operon transcriptional repressor
MIKCEYVDDLAEVLDQMLNNCARITEKIEQLYTRAKEKGLLKANQSPAELAMDTHLYFIGLLHMWVKDIEGCRFRNQATELVKTHVNLRRH